MPASNHERCGTHRVGRWSPLLFLLLAAAPAFAEPSVVVTTSPQAIAPGQELSLTVRGQRLAGATQLWTTFSDPAPISAEPANNGQNDGECLFHVKAPAEAALGVHAIRVISPNGASALFPLLIDDLPTVAEATGNNSRQSAQEIPSLCAVDGRIDNLSRDYFKFPVKKGQTISFEVFARRLGSPLDASIYLYDAEGHILGYCDDAEGLSSDPQMVHEFDADGVCVVEIRDIRYQGGDSFFYRLRIGDFPCVNCTAPLAVQKGEQSRVDFAGISVKDASPAFVSVPGDWSHEWFPVSTRRANGQSSGFAMVTVTDRPDVTEQEPNNTQPQAQRVTLGSSINGRFEAEGDVDRYTFTASQGQRYSFRGVTREQGAPSDLLLRMLDAAGNQVAVADDNGTAEGTLDVTFPSDGEFTLEISDLNRRGGPQFAYRIAESPISAGFSLSASADTVNVPLGGVATLTVSTARREYGGPIAVVVEGLPAGYSIPETFLGPGVDQVMLTIQSAKDAPAASLTNVAIVGRATIGDQPVEARATVSDALRTRWSNATYVSPRFNKALALSQSPQSGVTLKVDPPVVVFGKNLKADVKVIAERAEGFDEAIQLAVNPPQGGLPPNITAELKPIDKGQQETTITFTANENAALGPFTVVLSGTHQKNNVATIASTPGIGLRLEEPLKVTATPMSDLAVPRGQELKFNVAVQRNPALSGEVRLALEKLPAGVSAAETVLGADQSEVVVTLTATAESQPMQASGIEVRATSTADPKLTAVTVLPAFTIQ